MSANKNEICEVAEIPCIRNGKEHRAAVNNSALRTVPIEYLRRRCFDENGKLKPEMRESAEYREYLYRQLAGKKKRANKIEIR